MEIRTHALTYDAITAIIERIGADSYGANLAAHNDSRPHYPNGDGYRGRITVRDSHAPGARRSGIGHPMSAACWHAFRDVFAAVFDADPDATIVTVLARYEGHDGFLLTYPGTGFRNVGSLAAPVTLPQLCDCDSRGVF